MFGNGRRRSFDRTNNNEQNSTGYSEKTVFSTDFGAPENSNFQNGYAQQPAPQNNAYDGGYAQNPFADNGGYVQPAPAPAPAATQGYGYAPSTAAPTTTAQASDLPMVFASRKHSDIYVYEYADRVEWYLKTATCMHLFNIERKK